MSMLNPEKSLLFLLLLASGFAGVNAQLVVSDFVDISPKLNSPLSRFGLGDPLDQVHAAAAGMGALESTYQDPFHLNLLNPASLANLQAATFEVGTYIRNSRITDQVQAANAWQGNIRYIALGFPLRNPVSLNLERQQNIWNAGMSFSLAPTSVVGYDLTLMGESADFGRTSNALRGDGAAYRFTWSTAVRYKSLSAGLNANFNFGKITNSRILVFEERPEALGSEFIEDFAIRGLNLGYGVQYAYNFKRTDEEGKLVPDGRRIIVGINGQLGRDIRTDATLLSRRFSPSGQLFVSDTLRFVEDQAGVLTLPASVTAGVAYEKFNKIFVGAEYGLRNNGAFRNDAQPDELLDAQRVAFGVQYIPNANSYNRFWQRVRYRVGIRLEEDGRAIDGQQARRNAITLGLGLPIRLPRQQISFFDLALEAGQFGIPDVLDENYIQLTLGFSLNDNSWFFKRKLN